MQAARIHVVVDRVPQRIVDETDSERFLYLKVLFIPPVEWGVTYPSRNMSSSLICSLPSAVRADPARLSHS